MNYFGQHLSAGDSAEPSSQATSRPADGSVLWDGTSVDHQGLSNAQGWPWLAPALSDILKKKSYWNVGNTIINHPPVITIHKWYVCSQMSGLWWFMIVLPPLKHKPTLCIFCSSYPLSKCTTQRSIWTVCLDKFVCQLLRMCPVVAFNLWHWPNLFIRCVAFILTFPKETAALQKWKVALLVVIGGKGKGNPLSSPTQ